MKDEESHTYVAIYREEGGELVYHYTDDRILSILSFNHNLTHTRLMYTVISTYLSPKQVKA